MIPTKPQQLMDARKEMFDQMEKKLTAGRTPEDSLFYYHPSEDRIVLSHALFWMMTKSFSGKIAKEKYFLLLRKYQEEMLEAYLTESDYFSELLRYCNIIYETLPYIIQGVYDLRKDKNARKLAAITVVAAGYAGDMPEDQSDELLDDIDFHFNKVKCNKIERMMPQLDKLVEEEIRSMYDYANLL